MLPAVPGRSRSGLLLRLGVRLPARGAGAVPGGLADRLRAIAASCLLSGGRKALDASPKAHACGASRPVLPRLLWMRPDVVPGRELLLRPYAAAAVCGRSPAQEAVRRGEMLPSDLRLMLT